MDKKNRNRILIVLLLLAVLGYYIYTTAKDKKPSLVVTGTGSNGSNVDGVEEVISVDNPVNTDTEELIGDTTNPTEVTDFTADQTTTCYTGCPNVQSVMVINGSCQENGLLDFPPPCAPPNGNTGLDSDLINTDDRVTGGVTPLPYGYGSGTGNIAQNPDVTGNIVDNTGVVTGGLGNSTSGMNSTIGLNQVSGLNCGGSSFANDVILNNSTIPEPVADTNYNVADLNNSIVDSGLQMESSSHGNQVPEMSDGLPFADGSDFVSSTGLANNLNPEQNINNATEVNQEGLGVFDFNTGIANAYDSNVVTTIGSSATSTTTGLPTRNRRS